MTRKVQLSRISRLRNNRDIIVFAADLNKANAPVSITYTDMLPLQDQLSNLNGTAVDLILETPGGSGEVAEDIVRLLRDKYENVGVIVPGYAKSAGTIMAMSADEILMDSASSLGPIDAQIQWQGKVFSADALLEGMKRIKKEVEDTGILNKAYVAGDFTGRTPKRRECPGIREVACQRLASPLQVSYMDYSFINRIVCDR